MSCRGVFSFHTISLQLKFAIKEYDDKGLLNDIKYCLMKLYYLYIKSTKKLRSLKEPIDELDGLVDLTDNNGVASIRSCGTRYNRHLSKMP